MTEAHVRQIEDALLNGWKSAGQFERPGPGCRDFSDALQCNHGITARRNLLLEFAVPEC